MSTNMLKFALLNSMKITSKNLDLIVGEDIKGERPSKDLLEDYEVATLELIDQWVRGEQAFVFHTSGSTGVPKRIEISREKIILSAEITLRYIDPDQTFKSALLCINPLFIGGAMVVFRALIFQLDLTVISPSGDLASQLQSDQYYDLTSMVPLQYEKTHAALLQNFRCILIGGGPLLGAIKLLNNTNVYSTYGMTETVSHIALRDVSTEDYSTLGDVTVKLIDGRLALCGSMTNHEWLLTNDLAELTDERTFKITGRADFIINSGGLKFNPEHIERKLQREVSTPYIVSSLPDKLLGEKIVLIVESEASYDISFDRLDKFERPKEVYWVASLEYSDSSKINRQKTQALIL